MSLFDSKIPAGPLSEKWTKYKSDAKLVNPSNKRKLDIIIIGSGLAGASAAASLGEPRRRGCCFDRRDLGAAPFASALRSSKGGAPAGRGHVDSRNKRHFFFTNSQHQNDR